MSAALVERYVLFDSVGWSTEIPGRYDRRDYHLGRKGELIELPGGEADRLEKLGAVSAEAVAVEAAIAAGTEPPSWSDVELDSANVDDTVAYLAQHPSEAARVLEAESSRDDRKLKVRKGVLEAAERTQAAYAEQVEADADARARAEEAEQAAYAATHGAASTAPSIPA